MELKFYIPELKALQLFIYYQLLEFQSLLSQQIYVIANTLLIHIWCSYLILAKDVLICLQQYAQIEFLPKSIITVPHSGSSDPQIKSLATTEHAQLRGFFQILTIRVPHGSSFLLEKEIIIYLKISGTHLKLKNIYHM